MFFFFKQKTAYEMRISDWSSDVCSSDLLLAIFGGGTRAEPGADCDVRDIGDTDRHAAARCDDDLRQITLIGCLARHTDQDLLAAAFDVAGAAVGIIALECSDDIVERQIECRQRSRVRRRMILPGVAAERVDLGDAGRSEEHTSELQSLLLISYAVFCLKKKQDIART